MPSKDVKDDLDTLQADVASFASSLGFTTAGLGTGFNDVDFRKKGRINLKKPQQDAERTNAQVEKQPLSTGVKRKATVSRSWDAKKKKLSSRTHTLNGNDSYLGRLSGSTGFSKEQRAKDHSKLFSKVWSLLKSGTWYEATAALLDQKETNESLGLKSTHASKHGNRDTTLKSNNAEDWNNLVAGIRKKGEDLMEKAAADYENSRGKDSDMRWLMIARKTGTTADRVAAFTVLLQDNPVANLRALDALLGMVTSKGGKRHAAMGIDALKELFVTSLLPDRKLQHLTQQPLLAQQNVQDGDGLLLLWYWEDCLKCRYEQFVAAMEEASKDKLPFLKEKAVKTIYELLKSKPEQERRLLCGLVNKLGDPERKVASNAGYYLSSLLTEHPNMKMVVVEEVDSFLFRPHVGLRSRYQAVVFLNQTVLSSRGDGPKLAKRLIDIYFSLFKVITAGESKDGNKGEGKEGSRDHGYRNGGNADADADAAVEIDSRVLSALLTGVNRAFPFVAADDVDIVIEEHTPVLFRLVHSKSFNVGVQALMLLYQLLAKNNTVSDRFYRALYSVLLTPGLAKSSKAEMFLGLVFKAIKSDINSKRMAAFAKRLMQVALHQAPQFACGCLLLLSEVLKSRPTLWNAVTQPENHDEETEHFHDILDEPTTARDTNVLSSQEDLSTTGLGNVGASRNKPIEGELCSESDEEINFQVPDLGDEENSSSADEGDDKEKEKGAKMIFDDREISAAWNMQAAFPRDPFSCTKKWPRNGYYNSRHRDPAFCNADQVCWWELTALASHVHPSVATMAKTLLFGASIIYSGDPLRDLALGVFLDRFAEKKPKSRRKDGNWHGSSLSAPPRKALTSTTLRVGLEFLQLSEREVPPEDVVFHKFYMSKSKKPKGKLGKEARIKDESVDGDGGKDDFLGGDSSDDDELENLLEQEEGMEMGLDEFSEEDNDSDGEFTYKQTDKELQAANEEATIDDNGKGGYKGVVLNIADRKQDRSVGGLKKRIKLKQSRKGRKDTGIFGEESIEKSPFASFDDYSHILIDENFDGTKRNISSTRKKGKEHKRSKQTC